MTKKNIALVFLLIGLVVVYAVWFTDWFQATPLKISYTTRNMDRLEARGAALPGLRFRVNPQVRFKELKVVPLAAYATNQNALPVWHLVSDSNSVPVDEFSYGFTIRGMRSAIKGMSAEALETNVTYRLFINAGRSKGQKDFELK
jgi:anti-sigma-K factor RskA